MKPILQRLAQPLTQKLIVSKAQIWRCLIQTPLYACTVIYLLEIVSFTFYSNFSKEIFEVLSEMFFVALIIAVIYFILVFLPTYFFQVLLLRYQALHFFSIIAYTFLFTMIVPSLIIILNTAQINIIPLRFFVILCFFSLTFAVTNWILLLRTANKSKTCSKLKFPN
ncbi:MULTISPECIES: hypothetical protein [unclassified Acinetobacter]|jgi:hypothetical protein|uniref:hypothetical protein n=1 Tax=unclassified Acinetobacter TaxID=196816 RepID=UPI0022AC0C18|nr:MULTISPECIES: hypothetical protein [unclassified Acinetobacter]WAU73889.1 hypothetical protein O1450_01785 [Acinetobacter sp. TR11]WAU76337.1 hypothetical protein O1449_13905 [Acinetobacter sp. TR3]